MVDMLQAKEYNLDRRDNVTISRYLSGNILAIKNRIAQIVNRIMLI